uniref:Peptidyl-alpha-hydroxyglycine alpha-amidating lyase 2 n=1 Tax=Cacopsylla melanoneura TaxID=428564 RepID=A0A8D9AYQ2_9HEMI
MPTAVAVASDGQFFVSDGYCNARVLKYNPQGHVVRVYPQQHEHLSLAIPHGVTLLEHHDLLCIADRENRRVTCVSAELRSPGQYSRSINIQPPGLGRVFAIASVGDLVFAVNGPTTPQIPVQGFTISPFSESVVDTWSPTSVRFHNPHGIAINKNGTELYVVETSPNRIWKFDTSQWVDMNQMAYVPLEPE